MEQIRWDLKKPCQDCPFKYDTADHAGVARDAHEVIWGLESGNFAHTCHKTDVRSDCPTAKGPAQHCAGLMIMAKKSNRVTEPMLRAGVDIEDDPEVMTTRDYLIKQMRVMKDQVPDLSDETFNRAYQVTGGFQYRDRK